jgi:hypothetical protein
MNVGKNPCNSDSQCANKEKRTDFSVMHKNRHGKLLFNSNCIERDHDKGNSPCFSGGGNLRQKHLLRQGRKGRASSLTGRSSWAPARSRVFIRFPGLKCRPRLASQTFAAAARPYLVCRRNRLPALGFLSLGKHPGVPQCPELPGLGELGRA